MSIGRTQEQTEGIESDALTFNVNVLYEATVDVNYAKTKTPINLTIELQNTFELKSKALLLKMVL